MTKPTKMSEVWTTHFCALHIENRDKKEMKQENMQKHQSLWLRVSQYDIVIELTIQHFTVTWSYLLKHEISCPPTWRKQLLKIHQVD